MFVCDSKPFRGILSTITFDVRGLDHRVRDYRLTVVPSPVIVATQLDCVFPDYMVNEQLSLWLPRTIELASGTQLPLGTDVTLRSQTNKDLTKVEIRDVLHGRDHDARRSHKMAAGRGNSNIVVEQLERQPVARMTLHDTDGVISDPPIRLYVVGIEDQPPVVKTNSARDRHRGHSRCRDSGPGRNQRRVRCGKKLV